MSVSVADAARSRAKRNTAERKRFADYKATAAAIEEGFGGATAGTIARLQEAPLARLVRRGRIDVWTLTAADGIQYAFHSAIGSPATHHPSLGIRCDPRADGANNAAARHTDAVLKYRQWRKDLAGTQELDAAMAVLVEEISPRTLDREYNRRNGTTVELLLVALRHYAALTGNTPRGARWRYTPQRLRPASK